LKKLSKNKHALWKAQVRAAIQGTRLQGFLSGNNKAPIVEIVIVKADGKEEKRLNPAIEDWEATYQHVLSYLLSSLGKEVLSQVSYYITAAQAWAIIEGLFGSQTRACNVNLRVALAIT
jgi:hypothetical protein